MVLLPNIKIYEIKKQSFSFPEKYSDNYLASIRLHVSIFIRGGRVVQWCWVNFQYRGVLLIWMIVGQGPSALAVGAGGVVWTFLISSIISLFFLPLSGRRPDID